MNPLKILFIFLFLVGCAPGEEEFPSAQEQFEQWLKTANINLEHYRGESIVPILKTEPLCAAIDCNIKYRINEREVSLWYIEDLFQRGINLKDAIYIGVAEYGGQYTFSLSEKGDRPPNLHRQ